MKFNVGDRVQCEGGEVATAIEVYGNPAAVAYVYENGSTSSAYAKNLTLVARALYLDDEDVAWLEDVGKQENFRAPDFWERHGKLLARAKGEQP